MHPKLSFEPLDETEIDLLRSIYEAALKGKLVIQSDYIVTGGDIRNFLRAGANPRLTAPFSSFLYNRVFSDVLPEAEKHERHDVVEMIYRLHEHGARVKRNKHHVTIHMDRMIEGSMDDYNVPERERRTFIGYRFKTDRSIVLRFVVHIFIDDEIDRTKFWSYCNINETVVSGRETKGFAYHSDGNVYILGFINGSLGCEFNVFRRTNHKRVRAGLITTTSISGNPVAKQCVLVEAQHTVFADILKQHFLEKESGKLMPKSSAVTSIANYMLPIEAGQVQNDMKDSIDIPIINLLQRDEEDIMSVRMLPLIEY